MEKVSKCTGEVHTTWLPAPNLNFSVPPIGSIPGQHPGAIHALLRGKEKRKGKEKGA